MRKRILGAVVALFATGCLTAGHCRDSPPPVPIEPLDTENCHFACIHLRDLGCEEGYPLEDGTTCEDFCVRTHQAGHSLSPTCVLTIRSCDELDGMCSSPRALTLPELN